MKAKKHSLFAKYRKEALILSLGFSLVLMLVFNLSAPKSKRDVASHNETSQTDAHYLETLTAAKKVEEEQEEQSQRLSQFKVKFAKFIRTKNCLKSKTCEQSDLSYQLEELRPYLIANWFRLNNKSREQIVSSIGLEDHLIKAQIIELLLALTLDESKNYLSVVLHEVIDNHQAELINKTFKFIKKTSTPENEIQIAKRLLRAMQSGGPELSEAMNKDLPIIISPNTEEIFKEALSSHPKQVVETDLLSSAIEKASHTSAQVVNR